MRTNPANNTKPEDMGKGTMESGTGYCNTCSPLMGPDILFHGQCPTCYADGIGCGGLFATLPAAIAFVEQVCGRCNEDMTAALAAYFE